MTDTAVVHGPWPVCDLCTHLGESPHPAAYDAATRMGSWAYLCERHFREYGYGLGTGVGQRLIPSPNGPSNRRERSQHTL